MSLPSPSYLEFEGHGPVRVADISWLELSRFESRYVGRLVPKLSIDHSEQIMQALDRDAIAYSVYENYFRIEF